MTNDSLRSTVICTMILTLAASTGIASDSNAPTVPSQPASHAQTAHTNLCGTWSGQWCSQSTGHNGPMKAEFRRLCGDQYEVTFNGRFCRLIPFRYKAVLHARQNDDGTVSLHGSRNLGLLFGTFSFRATTDGNQLNARYWSEQDIGTFRLTRNCR